MIARWLFLTLVAAVAGSAQRTDTPAAPGERVLALRRDPAVAAVLDQLRATEEATLAIQTQLCEVPAPPFKEAARARTVEALFKKAGLAEVRIDAAGNVIGDRPGTTLRPRLILSAHLDTVFPEGTDVRVRRDGHLLTGPGIGDDCRGLAVMVRVATLLGGGRLQTEGTVTFVATVGEEGLGDLRGARHLFEGPLRGAVDRFVSIDGAGLGTVATAVGSLRYRVAFTGPGGHSYGDFGLANPIYALGRAASALGSLPVPDTPRTTISVGRVGGGTSVNSIPFEAWMEVDLRSSSSSALTTLDRQARAAVQGAVDDENRRAAGKGHIAADWRKVGERPAGRTPEGDPLLIWLRAIDRVVGADGRLREGSTDANVPMGLGIPAVTIGGGGRASGAHTPAERFDATDAWKGTERAFLAALILTRSESLR